MYLIRYGEIAIKGLNRGYFENQLKQNIANFLKKNKIKYDEIVRKRGRILLFTQENAEEVKKVFGITSISKAIIAELNIEDIKKKTIPLIKNKKFNTFRVNSRRLTKDFDLNSNQINIELGSFIEKTAKKKVNLSNPDLTIYVEIIEDKAYVFDKKIQAYGGLPVGTEGKVVSLIENKESINASLLMMKRGCSIIPVGYENKDIQLLDKYSSTPLKLKIIKNLKEIEKLDPKALVVSQNLNNFKELDTKLTVLRPLISSHAPIIK
ncbi:hypothetical protein HQ529_00515 [Candidatus Woesearchaeota archaeon]|nr:hypothetical protein [Candidatus Woesearchaeota archaeon]